MPRPKTKDELLNLSMENFQKLLDFINQLDVEERNKEFPIGTMNRNIRDVLMHIHHWHLMMLEWYKTGMAGEKPDMPAKGYTWRTVPQLNRWILEKYQGLSLEEAQKQYTTTHEQLSHIIKSHSEDELFEKKRYKWTGSTSLAAYLISSTSSHYDWGLKLIKKAKK